MVEFFNNIENFSNVFFYTVYIGFKVKMRFNIYKKFN